LFWICKFRNIIVTASFYSCGVGRGMHLFLADHADMPGYFRGMSHMSTMLNKDGAGKR